MNALSSAQTWRNQRERRYHLDRESARHMLALILRNLPEYRYDGAASTTVVTTYLDTRHGHYLDMAERCDSEQTIKMRVREYLCAGREPDAHCYLERKQRDGDVRLKQRIRVAKSDVVAMFLGDVPVPNGTPEAGAVRAEIEKLKLRAVLISSYERRVFGVDDSLRVTYDERVGFYAPPSGLYNVAPALTPDVLGPALGRGPSRILEVKQPAQDVAPAWLDDMLADEPNQPGYSKFRDGMRALELSDGKPVNLTRRLNVRKLEP